MTSEHDARRNGSARRATTGGHPANWQGSQPRHGPTESAAEWAARIRQALAYGQPSCACTRGGERGVSHCPAHPDERPSLAIDVSAGGTVVWFCHAGCSQVSVRNALVARGLWHNPRREGGALITLENAQTCKP